MLHRNAFNTLKHSNCAYFDATIAGVLHFKSSARKSTNDCSCVSKISKVFELPILHAQCTALKPSPSQNPKTSMCSLLRSASVIDADASRSLNADAIASGVLPL